jgi:glycosyltransferase involved in cell wall biosynthesis
MSTFSIITPTIGRESLNVSLDSALPQLQEGDEILVIGDGPQPRAKEICESKKSPFITYWEVPFTRNYGNPGRNDAIAKAKGSHLFFVDDDDAVLPDAIKAMRKVADEYPNRPLLFKMHHPHVGILYRTERIVCGNLSGQMFVPPNVKERLGRWSGKYAADFDFVSSTLSLYPGGEKDVVYRYEVTVRMGCAGPTGVELP